MSEARVEWTDANGKPRDLNVRINGDSPTYRLRADRIESALLRGVDALQLDLLDIAAVFHCTDSSVSRGGDVRAGFGQRWHRDLDVEIAVRNPAFWSDPETRDALEDCIGFLTDDTVKLRFVQGVGHGEPPSYLDFSGSDDVPVDDVVLFSGGLDSFAGALQILCETDRRVALVTHRSAPKTISCQERLGKYLRDRFPKRVLHIQVEAQRVGTSATESTLRSRSFLFAALGHVVAQCLGATRISFFENGVVSHNLPISPQVIGSMATRTTHPLTIRKFCTVLDRQHPIAILAPFEWLTKVDILRIIERHGAADQIRVTNSCAHVREQNLLHTHCGNCSQCIDRRFAVLAAGLSHLDPEEMYGTDVIFGERDQPRSRTLALEWTRHALSIEGLSKPGFIQKFIGELTRIIEGYPERLEISTFDATFDLHVRHAANVRTAIESAISAHPDRIMSLSSRPNSLIAAVINQIDHGRVPRIPVQQTPTPEADNTEKTMFDRNRMEVSFHCHNGEYSLTVHGLGDVHGAPARIGHDLLPTYQEDLANNLSAVNYRFVSTGTLAVIQETSKSAVTRNVKRCRDALLEFYQGLYDEPPADPLLIQSRKPQGYRLDPDCRVTKVR